MSAVATLDYGTAELCAGDARVIIAPALGGKIISMQLGGREWLWSDERVPHRPGGEPDSGGLDECFPTVAACSLGVIAGRFEALHLPNAYSGLEFPEHGELWSQSCAFSLETRDEGVYATCGWVGKRMPYRFARALYVSRDGRVVMRYGVTNDGLDRLPYVWCSHSLFPLTKQTRIELADASRLRVWRQHGVEFGGAGAEHRWPRIASAGRLHDLSKPYELARRYACRLFVDSPTGRAAIVEDGVRLELSFDAQSPCVAVWINRQGWTPHRKRKAPMHLSVGPSSGAPDSLGDALGSWKSASWLEPRETREWTVTWSASPAR